MSVKRLLNYVNHVNIDTHLRQEEKNRYRCDDSNNSLQPQTLVYLKDLIITVPSSRLRSCCVFLSCQIDLRQGYLTL